MDQLIPWILRALGGAAGGNAVGKIFSKLSLGKIGNTIAGILGGGLGGQLLQSLGLGAANTEALDPSTAATSVGASAAGGGVVLAVIGLVKKFLGGKKIQSDGDS